MALAFALYGVGVDAARLAANPGTMQLMVLRPAQAFAALRSAGNTQIPSNLRSLYRLPNVFVVAYPRRVLASPRGELGSPRARPRRPRGNAHSRRATKGCAAPRSGRPTPDVDRFSAPHSETPERINEATNNAA